MEYKRLSEIQKQKQILTYSDLLSTTEWKSKRDYIVNRDDSKCKICGKEESVTNQIDGYRNMTDDEKFKFIENAKKEFLSWEGAKEWMEMIGGFPKFATPMIKKEGFIENDPITLHVHHKYYIKNKYPWDYEENVLITVCNKCHINIHETETILIYENESLEKSSITITCTKCNGSGHLSQYYYFMNGICFNCNGKGIIE